MVVEMSNNLMDRRAAVSKLLGQRDGALVVTGLGSPSYDVHASGDRDDNYYLWGAMGSAALTGLGLAQAQPDKKVLVITGDGEMLMGFGALATIAVARPRNLDIVVLDNHHYGETGRGVSLADAAAACGFERTGTFTDLSQLDGLCSQLKQARQGPGFFVLKIVAENLQRSLPPRDATYVKTRFRANLGLHPC